MPWCFRKNKKDLPIAPLPKRVVVVLHGLAATPLIMQGLADYLTEKGGLHVENVGYASTLEDIPAAPDRSRHVIRGLEGVEQVDFVAHSLGNIVIRRFLGDMEGLDPKTDRRSNLVEW